MANEEKNDKTRVEGTLGVPGIGQISISKLLGVNQLRIIKPEEEETNKKKVHLIGDGAHRGWRIIVINWILGNKCYIQKGIATPYADGEWTALTEFSPSSNKAERLIFALAVKTKDVDRVKKLFNSSDSFPDISSIEQMLKANHIWFQLSRSKKLVYLSDVKEEGFTQSKMKRVVSAGLNVRAKPGDKGTIVTTLKQNSKVMLLGEVKEVEESVWVKIQVGSDTGWVNGRYLKE